MKREFRWLSAIVLVLAMTLSFFPATKKVMASSDTTYNKIDYAPVFDSTYYANKYSDLKQAFGNDQKALFNHFIKFGMNEARQAKETFNVNVYKANYSDLRDAFGNNLPLYYQHYITNGIKENRNAVTLISSGNPTPTPTPKATKAQYVTTLDMPEPLSISHIRTVDGPDKCTVILHKDDAQIKSFQIGGWTLHANTIAGYMYNLSVRNKNNSYTLKWYGKSVKSVSDKQELNGVRKEFGFTSNSNTR